MITHSRTGNVAAAADLEEVFAAMGLVAVKVE